jgi:methylmalonyl-CoA mutase
LFQEIEAAGGAAEALTAGLIQKKVAQVRAERENAVATRADALTGTSDYPDLSETSVKVLDIRPVSAAVPRFPISYPALPRVRLAEPYERLRDASDRMLAKTGSRPKVFLANLGIVGEFTARALFAKNFFEAGGIEAVADAGSPAVADMVASFKKSGAKLACLCSSDEVYGRESAAAARALVAAGAEYIYLAGRPRGEAALKAAGVGTFVFSGCDALIILKELHRLLDIGAA